MSSRRLNCWEYKQCGREPGGVNVDKLGVCPTATSELFDGYNGGTNAGRICWIVAGTLCEGEVQGTFAARFANCYQCDFYRRVAREERAQPSVISVT